AIASTCKRDREKRNKASCGGAPSRQRDCHPERPRSPSSPTDSHRPVRGARTLACAPGRIPAGTRPCCGGRRSDLFGRYGTMTNRTWRQQRTTSRPSGGRRRRFKPQAEPLEERIVLDFRSITGFGNNVLNPTWGSTNVALLRMSPAAYADGISSPVV